MKRDPITVTVRPFRRQDQPAVRELILAGLEAHWGERDPSKNRDLDDIAATYAEAIFLVASRDGEIVGTGALVPRGDGIAEIVRMSVAAGARRQGIATMLLRELCRHAAAEGRHHIVLETTSTWQDVIQFYLRRGFRITHHQDGDTYFALDLARHDESA